MDHFKPHIRDPHQKILKAPKQTTNERGGFDSPGPAATRCHLGVRREVFAQLLVALFGMVLMILYVLSLDVIYFVWVFNPPRSLCFWEDVLVVGRMNKFVEIKQSIQHPTLKLQQFQPQTVWLATSRLIQTETSRTQQKLKVHLLAQRCSEVFRSRKRSTRCRRPSGLWTSHTQLASSRSPVENKNRKDRFLGQPGEKPKVF